MPEGHTIHRLARLHRRALRGRTVAVTSPQDRFAAGAALLDGLTSTGVDAYGKHLFYRWSDGPTLHVHLGLYGKFRGYGEAAPLPTAGTRLTMATGDVTLHLAGPTACELLDPGEERRLRERLGPDPLGLRPDPAAFRANLSRRTLPIGAALLDRRVAAGIGNVYRRRRRASRVGVLARAALRPPTARPRRVARAGLRTCGRSVWQPPLPGAAASGSPRCYRAARPASAAGHPHGVPRGAALHLDRDAPDRGAARIEGD
ncbi:MAG: hypothetical protein H0V05_02665, partial [Euzebyaceae bacterium]|nr:hypothetical protein [Euzebyaceae bacterium]